MAKFKVIVTEDVGEGFEIERAVLAAAGAELEVCRDRSKLMDALRNADGVLVNLAPLPRNFIEAMERCKIISRYGIGYDNVDIETCTRKGIWLANVPVYCQTEVAEHTLALLMSCARCIPQKNQRVRAGVWDTKRKDNIIRLRGKSIGLLGFGSIPQSLVPALHALGLVVSAYDPFVDRDKMNALGVEKAELDALLESADFVCVHLPCNERTRGLIGKQKLSRIKEGAVIINTSRGGIVDEAALVQELANGHLSAAGLDVFEHEPLAKDSALLQLENCIVTDHCAWYSPESLVELKAKCAENVCDVLLGGQPKYPVNSIG